MTRVGDEFTLAVTPDRHLPVRYAGASGDFNPIHYDERFAQSVGLPGTILHGLWSMAQVARAHTEAFGGPQALAGLTVEFRGMGVPEREVVVHGSVTEIRDGIAHTRAEATQEATRIVRRAAGEIRLP
jgi:acyl dehydratase